jgi:hypothetical protein
MQVSIAHAALRHTTVQISPLPTGVDSGSSGPPATAARPSGGAISELGAHFANAAGARGGLTQIELDRSPGHGHAVPGHETDAAHRRPEAQIVRRRLAALDQMVSKRLDAFVERHAADNPGLAQETGALARDFHAALGEAYDAFRESGDRRELWRSVREAFTQTRSGFRLVASTLGAPANDPVVVVDPGPGPDEAGGAVAEEEPAGGSTTVPGAPGSGVTVAVTPLPEAPPPEGGSEASSLSEILAQLVAHFSEVLSGVEDLLGETMDESSLQLAINLELQLGGSSVGVLLDTAG